MESKKWEALLAAVDAGSFSSAAEKLGYTQSGLTHMMNSLEKEVGFSLLMRGHYGVRLTPSGQRLLSSMREFILASNRLEREIDAINGTKAESLRVAAFASMAVHWLPAIVRRFREEYPCIQVDIALVNSVEELCDSIREDRADLAFGSRPKSADYSEFHWLHLKDDPLLAVLPPDYPFGNRTNFPLEEFNGKKFLVSSQGFDPTILDTMEELGIHPDIRPTPMDDLTVITLVSNGLGVSMLTELVLEGNRENVRALPVVPVSFRDLGILTHPSRDTVPAVRRFLSCAEGTFQELHTQKTKEYREKKLGNLAI